MRITASMLYDFLQCPHRPWRDRFGPLNEKSQETNPFVELLWKRGLAHEDKMVAREGELLDISDIEPDKREEATSIAMSQGAPLIYQGVISHGDLYGIPDLLKLEDGEYIPIDIKSGAAQEGVSTDDKDGKLKKQYAVQLALYVDILMQKGFLKKRVGKIIDRSEKEITYDLESFLSTQINQTFWQFYKEQKSELLSSLSNETEITPAMAGVCKLCPWFQSCRNWCEKNDDLSRLFYMGRRDRAPIQKDLGINTVSQLMSLDVKDAIERKKAEGSDFLHGIGETKLTKAVRRAKLLVENRPPVLLQPITLPKVKFELFFDIEDDPTNEFVYMHGVYERTQNSERFIDFTAKDLSMEEEKQAWAGFWTYIWGLPENDFAVYYYSSHEKTTYKKLQEKYPDVLTSEQVLHFFEKENVIDLYSMIFSSTDWPLGSYSLKEIAQYLGFKWRDETPSGALSIKWFNEYIEKKDEAILIRLLEYNEDDCKATMVIKDALDRMSKC